MCSAIRVLRLKAARGELHTTATIGYRRGADGRLEQDPDRRINETLSMVFRKLSVLTVKTSRSSCR
jgi:hypothetical protein